MLEILVDSWFLSRVGERNRKFLTRGPIYGHREVAGRPKGRTGYAGVHGSSRPSGLDTTLELGRLEDDEWQACKL